MENWNGDDRRQEQELPISLARWTGTIDTKMTEVEKKVDKLTDIVSTLTKERHEQKGGWKTLLVIMSIASAIGSGLSNRLLDSFLGGRSYDREYPTTNEKSRHRCNPSDMSCIGDRSTLVVK